MRGLFPLYLGLRNLLGRRRRLSPHLLGSILGIALSLVPLIVVLEVADGMIEGITRRYLEVGTYHAQVVLPLATRGEAGGDGRRRCAPSRGCATPWWSSRVWAWPPGPGGARRSPSAPCPRSCTREDEGFRRYFRLEAGSFDLASPGSLLLGRELAGRLGVGRGRPPAPADPARERPQPAAGEQPSRCGASSPPATRSWTSSGSTSPWRPPSGLLGARGGSRFIGLKLDDPFNGLERQLARLDLPEQAQVYSWYQLEKASYKSFQTTRALLLFIMALIVAVAAVNVSSSLVMVVLEKTPEIAMLKAMGAGPWAIGLAFTVTALATGLAGTVLGLALGALVCREYQRPAGRVGAHPESGRPGRLPLAVPDSAAAEASRHPPVQHRVLPGADPHLLELPRAGRDRRRHDAAGRPGGLAAGPQGRGHPAAGSAAPRLTAAFAR